MSPTFSPGIRGLRLLERNLGSRNGIVGWVTGKAVTFAVALVGEEDHGWLLKAVSADEAIDIVHGTVPPASGVWRRS